MAKRDSKGRWIKGCKSPNPKGRTPRQVEREYLDVTMDSVSTDEWRRVVRKALEDAMAGDAKARDWLSRWLMPREGQTVDDTIREMIELQVVVPGES